MSSDLQQGRVDAKKQIQVFRETAELLGVDVDDYTATLIDASIVVIKTDIPTDPRAKSKSYYQGFLAVLQEAN